MGQTTTRIYDATYTSEINEGMKYHIEVYRIYNDYLEENAKLTELQAQYSQIPVASRTEKQKKILLQQPQWPNYYVESRVDDIIIYAVICNTPEEVTKHMTLKTSQYRILTGQNLRVTDIAADYCDRVSIPDYQTVINNHTIEQKYYKTQDSNNITVVSYIDGSEYSRDNISSAIYSYAYLNLAIQSITSAVEKNRNKFTTAVLAMASPDTDTTIVPVNLPATTSGTYTTESTNYNYRVTFTEEISGEYTIVTYTTEYGTNNNYNMVYSTKQVEFDSNNYSSAEAYLEAYGNAEILALQRTLDIADKNLSLVIDAEDISPFSEPQSDKNVAIRDKTGDNHYIPLAQYVDTSSLITIVQIPSQTGTLTYEKGVTKIPVWSAYDPSQFVISGDEQGMDAGSYYLILTPATGYMWSNGTITPRSIEWKIQPKKIEVPAVTNTSFYYEPGNTYSPTIASYDTSIIDVANTTATTAGTYYLTFVFKEDIAHNYEWTTNNVIEWTVYAKVIPNPKVAVTSFEYNFANHYLDIEDYDEAWMTKTGDVAAEVGEHNCIFTLIDPSTVWENSYTSSNYSIPWEIKKAAVTVPTIENTSFTYIAGTTYTLTPINIEEDYLDLYIRQTDTSKQSSGSYTGIFGLRDKTRTYWNDTTSSTTDIQIPWIINKASPETVLSTYAITLEQITPSLNIVVTRSGNGIIQAMSTNEDVLQVAVNNTVITATATGYGTAAIAVQILEGTDYQSETGIIVTVTSTYLPPLASCNPARISSVLKADKVKAAGWKVGDYFSVFISGTVGTLQINGNYRAVLIGIDHNKDQEATNRLHFIVGQDSTGKNIAFCDNNRTVASSNGTAYFQHNLITASNTGGWEASALRDRCEEFFNALTPALQNIISPCNKFSDVVGAENNNMASVVPVLDKVWLLSEYEVFGIRSKANSAESLNQKQYEYFKDGTTRTRYKHNSTNLSVDWLLRSPDSTNTTSFTRVYNNTLSTLQANVSSGLVFGFTIGDGTEVSILDAISWDSLTEYLKAGTILNYLSVGDTKAITFTPYNENSFFAKPETYRATVLSVEHNTTYEAPNKIHFAINKDKFGRPTALCDGNYDNTSIVTTSYYSQHNQTLQQNIGGWNSSFIKNNTLERYYRDLPQDLQDNITNCDKYTDNTAGTNNLSQSITVTTQKFWLLAEYEVFGTCTYANYYEQLYQTQYEYFKNLTSLVHYHNSEQEDIPVRWWLRSPNANSSSAFCTVGIDGTNSLEHNTANYSLGIVPCFTIGDGSVAGLETFSWSQIAAYAKDGTLANYAQVGDSKTVQLTGMIGTKEISGTYRAVIIAMEHNVEFEGKNRVHFAIGLNTSKEDIVFTDGMAEQSIDGTAYFQHNLTGVSNVGGWAISALRTRCQEIYQAIEPALRPYISFHHKRTNNSGGGNSILNLSSTYDYVWIPSYYEVLSSGSTYQEATEQAHYTYFDNKLLRKSHEGTTPVAWWTRTPMESQAARFLSVDIQDGTAVAKTREANKSAGILPCFVLGDTSDTKDLSGLTWELIKTYTQNGTLLQYAELGQYKPIQISGTVGTLSINGTYGVRLIGFNHNIQVEGENRAHFMICAANGSNMAFVDEYYNSYTPKNNSLGFAPFSGFRSSDFDYDYKDNRCTIRDLLNQDFLQALPTALRAVIQPCKKSSLKIRYGYTAANRDSVETEDNIWLPGVKEVSATDIQPNNTEQYSYYSVTTMGPVYAHNNSTLSVKYWFRDAAFQKNATCWHSGENRTINKTYPGYSLGIIPCFTIA